MKLTVPTILTALVLASGTQAAPIDPNAVGRRNFEEPDQIVQSIAAGLQSYASHFGHFGSLPHASDSRDDGRNAAVVANTEYISQLSVPMNPSSSAAASPHSPSGSWATSSASTTPSSSSSASRATSIVFPTDSSSSRTSSPSQSSSDASSSSPSRSSSSSSAATGSSSSSGNSPLKGKNKLGLAWPNGGSMKIGNWLTKKVSWYYSWDATPGWKDAPTNITFCPMLWGHKNVGKFRAHVLNNQDSKFFKDKCVMGMNEVNQKGQSDISVSDACGLMRENILPLKRKGWYVVSPVTTNAPSGEKWMDKFLSTCPDVWNAIDAVAVHYYDTSVSKFQKYVEKWHDRYRKPVWVTEYACQNFNGGSQCSQSKARSFHTTMAKWFDEQDYVEAYSPFGVMQNMQGVASSNRLANGNNPTTLFNEIAN